MGILDNVLVTTARAGYTTPSVSGTSGITGTFTTHLTAMSAHTDTPGIRYAGYGDAALSSDYVLSFDPGTDIVEQDRITAIVLKQDGVTPWPNTSVTGANEYWQVMLAVEEPPMIMPHRLAFIKRIRGGGSTSL